MEKTVDVEKQLSSLALGDSAGLGAPSPPPHAPPPPEALPTLPGELLLKVMHKLAAENAKASLARLMRASKACYDLGLPVLHRHVAMFERRGRPTVDMWVRYLERKSAPYYGMMRALSVTVPGLHGTAEQGLQTLYAWRRVVARAFKKLTGLESAKLDLGAAMLPPERWARVAGLPYDDTLVFSTWGMPATLRSLDIEVGEGYPAGCYGILKALERHAAGPVFRSLSFHCSGRLLPELSKFPDSARKLRVLYATAYDLDEASIFIRGLADAVGSQAALEELHLGGPDGAAFQPLIAFLDRCCPRLRHLCLTFGRNMPDFSAYPRAAAALDQLDLRSADAGEWAAALTQPGVRPAEISCPAEVFWINTAERLLSNARWVRTLKITFPCGRPVDPDEVMAIVPLSLPPCLVSLSIDVHTELVPGDPRWFVDGMAEGLPSFGLPFALEVVEWAMAPGPTGGHRRVATEERVWRWRKVGGLWDFVDES
ncbi:hypothetical protein DFJ74DRAFT_745477 [Hyaloraphidium curvatum]|nr:hypothetical protein DFJ74DRAFT_745477 [Hyaloraphidium curvatum]